MMRSNRANKWSSKKCWAHSIKKMEMSKSKTKMLKKEPREMENQRKNEKKKDEKKDKENDPSLDEK